MASPPKSWLLSPLGSPVPSDWATHHGEESRRGLTLGMRFINTHTHGILDYIVGIILAASPWLLGFARGGVETTVPVVLGLGALAYSLMTRYELGLFKVLPMRAHLTLDFFSGALLAVSPWLFGFSEFVFWPHLIFGIIEMGAALMTQTQPRTITAPGAVEHHRV